MILFESVGCLDLAPTIQHNLCFCRVSIDGLGAILMLHFLDIAGLHHTWGPHQQLRQHCDILRGCAMIEVQKTWVHVPLCKRNLKWLFGSASSMLLFLILGCSSSISLTMNFAGVFCFILPEPSYTPQRDVEHKLTISQHTAGTFCCPLFTVGAAEPYATSGCAAASSAARGWGPTRASPPRRPRRPRHPRRPRRPRRPRGPHPRRSWRAGGAATAGARHRCRRRQWKGPAPR